MSTPAERAEWAALLAHPEFKAAWDDVVGTLRDVMNTGTGTGAARLKTLTDAVAEANRIAAELDA